MLLGLYPKGNLCSPAPPNIQLWSRQGVRQFPGASFNLWCPRWLWRTRRSTSGPENSRYILDCLYSPIRIFQLHNGLQASRTPRWSINGVFGYALVQDLVLLYLHVYRWGTLYLNILSIQRWRRYLQSPDWCVSLSLFRSQNAHLFAMFFFQVFNLDWVWSREDFWSYNIHWNLGLDRFMLWDSKKRGTS